MRRTISMAATATVAGAVLVTAGCSSSAGGHGAVAGGTGTPTGTGAPVTAATTPLPSPTTSAPSSGPTARPVGPAPALHHFRIADVTWVGSEGWALGQADCLSGPGRCDAIEHTSDGRTWSSLPAPSGAQASLPGEPRACTGTCVTGIRFATPSLGYVFGSSIYNTNGTGAFYVTRDGGRSWHRQPGGAEAVETLDGTVIRLEYAHGLPGPFSVQVAGLDASSWRSVTLPGAVPDFGGLLARAAHGSYVLGLGHTAGGAQDARSMLWTSTDGGDRWTRHGEPCPQSGYREVDSYAVSAAPDGSVSVLCSPRGGAGDPFTATSTDGGASFHAGRRNALGSAVTLGAASARTLVVCADDAYRSTDGGRTWTRLGANAGSSPGNCASVGFASPTLGHAVSGDRRTLFTTTDGGADWSAHRFA